LWFIALTADACELIPGRKAAEPLADPVAASFTM